MQHEKDGQLGRDVLLIDEAANLGVICLLGMNLGLSQARDASQLDTIN
jgi:hypothetical protein